jgi:hypothetical protein
MLGRNTKNPEFDSHYSKYCKILLEVIKQQKNYKNLLQTPITELELPGILSE